MFGGLYVTVELEIFSRRWADCQVAESDFRPLSIFGWITAAVFGLVSVPMLYYMMNMKQPAEV